MTKGRTLRRIRKPSKKTYLLKGGQQALDYRNIQDLYVSQMEAKKELYNTIQKEGVTAYNYETSKKNNTSLTDIQNIVNFINTFRDTKNTEYNEIVNDIKNMIDKYGLEYKSYFIPSIQLLKESINDIDNLINYVLSIQTDFKNQIVHIHLISQRLGLLNSAKDSTNVINKQFESVKDSIEKIKTILVKEEEQKKTEKQAKNNRKAAKVGELAESVNTVKEFTNDPSTQFNPNSNPFVEGCPLGTVLGEDGKCNYYNDTILVKSIPRETKLINSDINSEWVIWFNNITPSSVNVPGNLNDPFVFERKPLQYLMRLRNDDIKYFTEKDDVYFNVKYIVTEQNGSLYKDPNGYYIFVKDIVEQSLNIPGFSKYYINSDNIPQAIQITDIPEEQKPILRNNLLQEKYFKALHDIDQILYGIKFIEVNKDETYNTIIPFYPNYSDYDLSGVDYMKLSNNRIDTIIYRYKGQFEKNLQDFNTPQLQVKPAQVLAPSPALRFFGGQIIPPSLLMAPEPIVVPAPVPEPVVAPAAAAAAVPLVFNSLSLDPHAYNAITNIYVNKYLQMSIDKYYNPFVFPQFFLNLGDYFIIHNIGNRPIIFNISGDSEEKRVVVYPNQLCCFVFTDYSNTLRYGFLFLDRYISYQTKSSKAAKYKDTYVFVENNQPLFDTEQNLISIPNFNPDTKIYYEYDDIFETTPKQISEIINIPILEYSISKKFYNYSSPFITLTTIGVTYVFCDSTGNPLLDILGYFIPVPSPIHYNNTKYIWYALEKVKEVTPLNNYDGVISIDELYNNKQFQSDYSTSVNAISIYINSQGLPLLANRESYLGVPPTAKTEVKQVQLYLPENFKITVIDGDASNLQIKTQMLVGLLKVYTQNTQVLETYYKDISGNMNNISSLKDELINTVNQIQISRDITDLNTNEVKAKQLYAQVLQTKANLEKYNGDILKRNIYNQEVNKVREIRNNDMANISLKIQTIKDDNLALIQFIATLTDNVNNNNNLDANSKTNILSKLNKSKLDINTIEQSEKTLEQSFKYVKNLIANSDTIENVNAQTQNVNVLLKSTESLERNVSTIAQTLKDLSVEITSNEANIKKEQVITLVNIIAENRMNVDKNTSYLESLPNDNQEINQQKEIIQNSIKVIDDIATNVANEQKVIVTFTPEIVDEQLIRYTNYLNNSIKNETQNITNAMTVIQNLQASASTTELVNYKTQLLEKINDYTKKHNSIGALLNNISSRITDEQKQRFEVELLENFNIVQDIENNINTLNTNMDVTNAINRIAEIDVLDSKIQYDIQVIELNTQNVPVPAAAIEETIVETSAPPPVDTLEQPLEQPVVQQPLEQKGGRNKKWQTRKQKRRKANTNTLVVAK